MDAQKQLAHRLRAAREAAGMSQETREAVEAIAAALFKHVREVHGREPEEDDVKEWIFGFYNYVIWSSPNLSAAEIAQLRNLQDRYRTGLSQIRG